MTDLSQPAGSARMWAADFESTGAVPGYPDQPWQFGMVAIAEGKVRPDESYVTYLRVDSSRPFSPFAPGSWSEQRARLAGAPELSALVNPLFARIGGLPLVAHNAATEKKFFRKAWPLHRPGPWIDTLKLARMAFPGLPAYDLESLVASLGLGDELARMLPGRRAHDALYDAAACAHLFCRILADERWAQRSLGDLVVASGTRRT